jgi:putative Holliday junction resolvase
MKAEGRLIGLDLGQRRIGVAVSDSGRTVATGVSTIERGSEPAAVHAAIAAVVEEYGAVGVVVGIPYSLGGETGAAAAAALAEVKELSEMLSVEVVTVDERLTTVAAAGALRAAGRRAKAQRAVIDRTAAAVILQSWIDRTATGSGCR